jgi:hypothetical protein
VRQNHFKNCARLVDSLAVGSVWVCFANANNKPFNW